jgi:RimJ/RimL family protein N-acetyltransferase
MIAFNNSFYARQICEASGATYNQAVDPSIARVEGETLLGGCVYQDYSGSNGSIWAHVASFAPRWLNPDMLYVMFHYPFVQLDCRKLFGTVPASNTAALKFDLKLGFEIEQTIKDVYPDGDMLLVSMYRNNCRWLGIKPRSIQNREAA